MAEKLDHRNIIIDSGEKKYPATTWPWKKIVDVFNRFVDNPEYQKEIGICSQLLSRITNDSWGEFLDLLNVNGDQVGPKQLLVISTINTFNITDVAVESEQCSGFDDRRAFQGNFSFNEAILAIEKLSGLMGEDLGDFHQRVAGIVDEQLKGMELVRQSREVGRIIYTVDQALEYRLRTVGEYYNLLADMGIGNIEGKQEFVKKLMLRQYSDDKSDIVQDLDTQVNPFLAVLAENGLEPLLRERIANFSGRRFDFDDFVRYPEIPWNLPRKLAIFDNETLDDYVYLERAVTLS